MNSILYYSRKGFQELIYITVYHDQTNKLNGALESGKIRGEQGWLEDSLGMLPQKDLTFVQHRNSQYQQVEQVQIASTNRWSRYTALMFWRYERIRRPIRYKQISRSSRKAVWGNRPSINLKLKQEKSENNNYTPRSRAEYQPRL